MNSLCLIASIPYYKLENGKNTDFAWCIQCFHHNQAPPISKQLYDIVKPHLHVSRVFIQNEQYQAS